MKRAAWKFSAICAALYALGCGGNSTTPPPSSTTSPVGLGGAGGAGGSGGAGGGTSTTPQPSPVGIINHVVVIVKENHTFDNFFGQFPGAHGSPRVNGQYQCPTGKPGVMATCKAAPDKLAHDLSHAHDAALADWNNGKMDGWSSPQGSDNVGGGLGDGAVYWQYTDKQIPNYWALAKKFVLADNFYSNMLGPSFPGHLFTVAAQAGWALGNPPTDLTANPLKLLGTPKFPLSPYWGCDEYQGGSLNLDLGFTTLQVGSWDKDTLEILPDGGLPSQSSFPCFPIKAIPDILPDGKTWKFYGTDWTQLGNNANLSSLSNPLTNDGGVLAAAEFAAIDLLMNTVLGQALPRVDEAWSMLDAVEHIRCATPQCKDGQPGALWQSNVAIAGTPWDPKNPSSTPDPANPVYQDFYNVSGRQPANVTWIVDQDEYSEHPDLNLNQFASWVNFPLGGVCDGENWSMGYVDMIQKSPYWKDTAIIITWDDFGGWYDHVPPPRQYGGDAKHPYGLGFRLPMLLISPYAKPGFIFHEQSEQASIAAFIEAVFASTTTLSAFDNAAQDGPERQGGGGVGANNLLHAFDFNQAPQGPITLDYPRICP